MGLEMLHMLVATVASDETINSVAEVYQQSENSLVFLQVSEPLRGRRECSLN